MIFFEHLVKKNSFFLILEKLCYSGLEILNQSPILIVESIPSIRNPSITQIVTFPEIVTPILTSRKCHYYEGRVSGVIIFFNNQFRCINRNTVERPFEEFEIYSWPLFIINNNNNETS